jgi:hypothetical protein
MATESMWIYFQVLFFITAFRLVAPVCLVYLIVSCLYGSLLVSPFLGLYAIAELAFFFFVYLPRRSRMQKASYSESFLRPSSNTGLACYPPTSIISFRTPNSLPKMRKPYHDRRQLPERLVLLS